jgi:hypothetical protein
VRFAIIVSCRLRELFSAYRKAGFDAIIIAVQLRSGQKQVAFQLPDRFETVPGSAEGFTALAELEGWRPIVDSLKQRSEQCLFQNPPKEAVRQQLSPPLTARDELGRVGGD